MHYFKLRDIIKFNSDSDSEAGETAGYPAGFAVAVENQNLNETEGSDANKI